MRAPALRAFALAAMSALALPVRPAAAGSQPITTLTPAPPSAPAPAPAQPSPSAGTPSQSPAAPSQSPAAPSQSPAAPSQSPTAPSQSPTAPSSPPAAPRAPSAPAPVAPAPPSATAATQKPASFELVDRGDAVEIIARNIKAARTAILPVRSRLEVPIVGAPNVKRVIPTDPTVKVIELDGDDAPRALSVKLGFERADVKTLSRFAQAIQVGDDLHLLIPRKIPAEGVAPRLPDPTLTPELAAAVARIEASAPMIGPRPDPSAARKAEPKSEARSDAKLDAKLDAKPDAKTDAKPDANAPAASNAPSSANAAQPAANDNPAHSASVVAPPLAGEPPAASADAKPHAAPDARPTAATSKPAGDGKLLKPALASDADDTWFKIAMYAALGLAAAGAGIWLLRRRRMNFTPPASIEIIAQRSLGAKARIVWLSAGPREMIVSVTAQQVRMLGQWRKPDVPASLPAAHTYSDDRYAPQEVIHERSEAIAVPRRTTSEFSAVVEKPMSPAVSGILRLRGRTGQMPAVLPEEIASGDVVADELWAKEILAATGARR